MWSRFFLKKRDTEVEDVTQRLENLIAKPLNDGQKALAEMKTLRRVLREVRGQMTLSVMEKTRAEFKLGKAKSDAKRIKINKELQIVQEDIHYLESKEAVHVRQLAQWSEFFRMWSLRNPHLKIEDDGL